MFSKKLHTYTHTHKHIRAPFLFISFFFCSRVGQVIRKSLCKSLQYWLIHIVSRSECGLLPILVDGHQSINGELNTHYMDSYYGMDDHESYTGECLRCHCLNGSIQGLQQRRQATVAQSQAIKK